jgi:hypothetical protein
MTVNVPDVPGVPSNLAFAPGASIGIVLAIADGTGISSSFASPQWGVYLNGGLTISANSVTDLSFKQEYVISDHPVEQGAFQSYDKVAVPFNPRVRFAASSAAARAALLSSIAGVIGDLNLYDVVTPEAIYVNCNFIHQDYHRTATSGLGLLQVDVWLEQVMQSATTGVSSAVNPASNDPTANGTVQPTTPSTSQESAVSSGLAGP